MFECEKCGGILSEGDKFCSSCGNENKNYAMPNEVSDKEEIIEVIEEENNAEELNEEESESLNDEELNPDLLKVNGLNDDYNQIREFIKKETKKAIIFNAIILLIPIVVVVSILKIYIKVKFTPIYIFGLVVGYLSMNVYILTTQRLFIKTNNPWWGIYIPIYNSWLAYKLGFENLTPLFIYILIVLYNYLSKFVKSMNNIFVALIELIILIWMYEKYISGLCDRFNKPTSFKVLFFFFPFIMITILAFDNSICEGEL